MPMISWDFSLFTWHTTEEFRSCLCIDGHQCGVSYQRKSSFLSDCLPVLHRSHHESNHRIEDFLSQKRCERWGERESACKQDDAKMIPTSCSDLTCTSMLSCMLSTITSTLISFRPISCARTSNSSNQCAGVAAMPSCGGCSDAPEFFRLLMDAALDLAE